MTDIDALSHPPAASRLIAASENVWRSIQLRQDGVPEVVHVLGTGVARGRLVKLGHWCDGRWTLELLVDSDGVELPPAGVLGTVVETDPIAGSFVVDFPIAGRNRFDVRSPAATALKSGYAELIPQVGAPLIDLRTLPEVVPPDRPELSLDPELFW